MSTTEEIESKSRTTVIGVRVSTFSQFFSITRRDRHKRFVIQFKAWENYNKNRGELL